MRIKLGGYTGVMLALERFEVYSIVTGTMRLDGGAMFGVVPKVMWEKCTEVDDLNRVALATRSLLAIDRSGGRVILVDTGCGTKWSPAEADRYAIRPVPAAIPDALRSAGLTPDDVTDVVVTHLHFDHNGGLTYWYDEPEGPTRLHYPKAKHWIHQRQWEHAASPYAKDRASYMERDFQGLAEAGVLSFVEGDTPPPSIPGVEWFLSHGHTPYQLLPILGSSRERLLFAGDVVPTVAHLRLLWVMAYDNRPLDTIAEKEAVYRRCFRDGLMMAFAHDAQVAGVAIDGTIERPIVARKLLL